MSRWPWSRFRRTQAGRSEHRRCRSPGRLWPIAASQPAVRRGKWRAARSRDPRPDESDRQSRNCSTRCPSRRCARTCGTQSSDRACRTGRRRLDTAPAYHQCPCDPAVFGAHGGRSDRRYRRLTQLWHVPYWRGMLRREPPRRPEPDAPPARRVIDRRPGSTGSSVSLRRMRHRQPAAGSNLLPVWLRRSDAAPTDGQQARAVATFTVDRLAYTPSRP